MKYSILSTQFLVLLFILVGCNSVNHPESQSAKVEIPTIPKSTVTQVFSNNAIPYIYTPRATSSLEFDSSVRSILEDSKGNLWFGSDKEGVCFFNGKTYQYLTIEDGLPNNQIRSIQEDNKGNIWFGTGGGIAYYDGEFMTIVSDSKTWNIPNHYDFSYSEKNAEWVNTEDDLWFDAGLNNGVCRWDGEQLHYLQMDMPPTDKILVENDKYINPYYVYDVFEDNDGNVWFGTQQKGAIGFMGDSFSHQYKEGPGLTLVRSIFQDKSGMYWFGDNGGGVYQYDGKELVSFTTKHGLDNERYMQKGEVSNQPGTLARVWDIEEDDKGNIWFATIDAGVWKYNGEQLINYTTKDGLTSNTVEVIHKDKGGRLWFGLGDGNVCRFDGISFFPFRGFDDC